MVYGILSIQNYTKYTTQYSHTLECSISNLHLSLRHLQLSSSFAPPNAELPWLVLKLSLDDGKTSMPNMGKVVLKLEFMPRTAVDQINIIPFYFHFWEHLFTFVFNESSVTRAFF